MEKVFSLWRRRLAQRLVLEWPGISTPLATPLPWLHSWRRYEVMGRLCSPSSKHTLSSYMHVPLLFGLICRMSLIRPHACYLFCGLSKLGILFEAWSYWCVLMLALSFEVASSVRAIPKAWSCWAWGPLLVYGMQCISHCYIIKYMHVHCIYNYNIHIHIHVCIYIRMGVSVLYCMQHVYTKNTN